MIHISHLTYVYSDSATVTALRITAGNYHCFSFLGKFDTPSGICPGRLRLLDLQRPQPPFQECGRTLRPTRRQNFPIGRTSRSTHHHVYSSRLRDARSPRLADYVPHRYPPTFDGWNLPPGVSRIVIEIDAIQVEYLHPEVRLDAEPAQESLFYTGPCFIIHNAPLVKSITIRMTIQALCD